MSARKSSRDLLARRGWDRFVFRVMVFALVTFAVTGSVFGIGTALFAFPVIDQPTRSDAALVLGPPTVQRLLTAQALVDDGTVDTIVISVPPGVERDAVHARLRTMCAGESAYTVICETPDPFTTQGEAHLATSLMTEHDWSSIVVITSVTHITRARLLFDRCLPEQGFTAQFVSDHRAYEAGRWVYEYLYQSGAMFKALINSDC